MFLNMKRNLFQSMLHIPALWYFDTSITYPPMISESQTCCNTATFCMAAIFVKYCNTTGSYNPWANLRCSGCSPLGEKCRERGLLFIHGLSSDKLYKNIFTIIVLFLKVPIVYMISDQSKNHTMHPLHIPQYFTLKQKCAYFCPKVVCCEIWDLEHNFIIYELNDIFVTDLKKMTNKSK